MEADVVTTTKMCCVFCNGYNIIRKTCCRRFVITDHIYYICVYLYLHQCVYVILVFVKGCAHMCVCPRIYAYMLTVL